MLSNWLIKVIIVMTLIFVSIVGVYIYSYFLGKEFSVSLLKFSKDYWYWIIPVIILLIFWHAGQFNPETFFNKRANSALIILVLLYKIVVWEFSHLRYKSTRFVADGISGSCWLYYKRGDYVILLLGTIDYVIPWKFNLKIVVLPRRKVHFMKDNILGKSHIYSFVQPDKITDLNKIPNEAKEFINSHWWISKQEVWYGEITQEEKEWEKEIWEENTEENKREFKGKIKPLAQLWKKLQFNHRNYNLAKGVAEGNPSAIKELYAGQKELEKITGNVDDE